VILESQTRGSPPSPSPLSPSLAAGARGARGTTARRTPARGRAAPAPAALKSIEPDRPRPLTGLVSQPLAQKKARPLEITPLASPISPIGSPLTQTSAGSASEHPSTDSLPTALTCGELRAMLAVPAKLREIALLGELLQPPLALRPPRRFR
jgi:hypothetical protein